MEETQGRSLSLHWLTRSALQSAGDPDQPSMETVLAAVFKECRKERLDYKATAVQCAASILEAHGIDQFQRLAGILFPLLSKVRTYPPQSLLRWQ